MKENRTANPARWLLPFAAAALVTLGGCSSVPQPVAELSGAETALVGAEGKDAQKHAPVELDRARTKLAEAKRAMEAEEFDKARRLSEEAKADAELAQAKVDTAQAKFAVNELEESIRVLREEIDRARAKR